MWLWFVIWGVIAFGIVAALDVIYKKEPPWFITGAWIIASINIFTAWANQGDLAAANKATAWAALLIFLHVTHWLYTKAKGGAKKLADAIPKKTHINDSIYDQIADEMSSGDINGGLMARAIAEADGDKDRTQAIYIKLRAAAIAKEREQARHDAADKEAEAWKDQAEKDAKAFVDAQKVINATPKKAFINVHPYTRAVLSRLGIVASIAGFLFSITIIGGLLSHKPMEPATPDDILMVIVALLIFAASAIGLHKLKW